MTPETITNIPKRIRDNQMLAKHQAYMRQLRREKVVKRWVGTFVLLFLIWLVWATAGIISHTLAEAGMGPALRVKA